MLYHPFESAGINIPLAKISVFAVLKDLKDQDLLSLIRGTVTVASNTGLMCSSAQRCPVPLFSTDLCPSNWLPSWSMTTHTTVQIKSGPGALPSDREQDWVSPGCPWLQYLGFSAWRGDRPAVPTLQVCPVLLSSLPDLCCSVQTLCSPSQCSELSCYFNII